jgi:hypothetical protein
MESVLFFVLSHGEGERFGGCLVREVVWWIASGKKKSSQALLNLYSSSGLKQTPLLLQL